MAYYDSEDWRYVAGILGPRKTVYGKTLHSPDQLPTDVELLKSVSQHNHSCDECSREDAISDIENYMSDLKLDEHSEYREALENFGENTFSQVVEMRKLISDFEANNTDLPESFSSFVEQISDVLDDIVVTQSSLWYLIAEGVGSFDEPLKSIINLLPMVKMTFRNSANAWFGEWEGIEFKLSAHDLVLTKENGDRLMIRSTGRVWLINKDTPTIILYVHELEESFGKWYSPTRFELEAYAMLNPSSARGIFVLDSFKNLF